MRRTSAKEKHPHTGLFIPDSGVRELIAQSKRTRVDGAGLLAFLQSIAVQWPRERVVFLCIGSDRSTGDALGPLVGDVLTARGWPQVRGTLAAPCDAGSLGAMLKTLPPEHLVIAVDACLGRAGSVGSFLVADGPLRPAQATGTAELPDVGHYSIAAVVNEQGAKPYHTLQTTSLHAVMRMAGELAEAICAAWPQHTNLENSR